MVGAPAATSACTGFAAPADVPVACASAAAPEVVPVASELEAAPGDVPPASELTTASAGMGSADVPAETPKPGTAEGAPMANGLLRLGRCRALARVILLLLALWFVVAAQEFSEAHGGGYPGGVTIGEIFLVATLFLLVGNIAAGVLYGRVAGRWRARHGERLDLEHATSDELDARERDATLAAGAFGGPLFGALAVWLLGSLCACDRLGLMKPDAPALVPGIDKRLILLVFVAIAALALPCAAQLGLWLAEAVKAACGWTKAAAERRVDLILDDYARWRRENPEEARRLDERLAAQEEAKARELEERRAEREREAAAARRRLQIRAAHRRNPALCPNCGSGNVMVLGDKVRPSVVGAIAGSSLGFIGSVAGAALLGKRRRELMCRDCGTRWVLR